ncbi:MAG: sodium:proton antiporter [Planctomycetes bacterium]|nr:sodium:proton antiporter [Planctomycetota bacterium]
MSTPEGSPSHPPIPRGVRLGTRVAAMALGAVAGAIAIRAVALGAHEPLTPLAERPDWWLGCVPFALLLLALAVVPLVAPLEHWWERNTSKLAFSGLMGLAALGWMAWRTGSGTALSAAAHGATEYVPFIVLLLSLYVIAGGVRVEGTLRGSTAANLSLLACGAVLANLLGTTGASMLLIRPLLEANRERRHQVHTVVFFIFIVSNVGGCLLPIGDPPLFLGYLRGVPFLWTLELWKAWLVTVGALLAVYAMVDRRMQRDERPLSASGPTTLRVRGWGSVFLLLLAVLAVAFVQPGRPLMGWVPPPLAREGALLLLAAASVGFEPWSARSRRGFSLAPMGEVAAVFAGIFLAMQVPLAVLESRGATLGLDSPTRLFWWTGGLSSVLDNAPTYLVFMGVARSVTLQAAGPDTVLLADGGWIRGDLLAGVSLGAVFLGAMTYIGNGPNLMVRAIASSAGVRMPGFGGYMLWSIGLLLPVLALASWLCLG